MIFAICIYALFVVESNRVPKLGGGGQTKFDNAKILTEHILEIHSYVFLFPVFKNTYLCVKIEKLVIIFFNF